MANALKVKVRCLGAYVYVGVCVRQLPPFNFEIKRGSPNHRRKKIKQNKTQNPTNQNWFRQQLSGGLSYQQTNCHWPARLTVGVNVAQYTICHAAGIYLMRFSPPAYFLEHKESSGCINVLQ